jgi:hypothetical protein
MSRPFAWSSFLALITGGMKAPSDGGLKTTMFSFSSDCARASLAIGKAASTAASANAAYWRLK